MRPALLTSTSPCTTACCDCCCRTPPAAPAAAAAAAAEGWPMSAATEAAMKPPMELPASTTGRRTTCSTKSATKALHASCRQTRGTGAQKQCDHHMNRREAGRSSAHHPQTRTHHEAATPSGLPGRRAAPASRCIHSLAGSARRRGSRRRPRRPRCRASALRTPQSRAPGRWRGDCRRLRQPQRAAAHTGSLSAGRRASASGATPRRRALACRPVGA